MKIGTINGAKRFTAVLLSIFILVPVVVLPANAEIIDKETSLTTNEVKFKEVSLGEWHSAAITSDGSLYNWGYKSELIGDGTTIDSSTPKKIMDNVVSVSLGDFHSAAITSDGCLYTWGNNGSGELGDGTKTSSSTPKKIMDNVVSVSLGYDHSAAITSDGSLYTWGKNQSLSQILDNDCGTP